MEDVADGRTDGTDHLGAAPTDAELLALTAREIAALVRDGRASAVRVAEAHLARIAERDPEVGAFQAHDPERVRVEAAAVDARPDRFALPLAGVPVAVKDNVAVSGYPTRHGSAATGTDPARRDDELVRRLRAAGAVIVGKTRMPELAIWGFTHSALGTTRNPHDPARDPGGSTGGGAAAVAAGMAALALGTDGGGSIRIPAAYCGLVGLKPGRDAVPLPGGADEHWCGLSVAGPLARSAADAALMFDVLAGRVGPRQQDGPEEPVPTDVNRVVLSLRSPFPVGRLHPDHRAAARGAAARLRADGVAVVLADPPYGWRLTGQWTRRWHAGVARDVDALDLDPSRLEPRTATIARKGRRVLRLTPPREGAPWRWRDRFLHWLDGHDLMVGPATAAGPFPAGRPVGGRYLPTLLRSAARTPYTPAWNLAGLPAVVVPVLVAGKPIGVQLVGRPGEEHRLLAVAARLEHRAVPTSTGAPRRIYV